MTSDRSTVYLVGINSIAGLRAGDCQFNCPSLVTFIGTFNKLLPVHGYAAFLIIYKVFL
jgi:hypothetical protein